MNARNPDIRPCETCGRRTRPRHMKSALAQGTVIRDGATCNGCNPPPGAKQQNSRMPISLKPLTAEEESVAQLMRSLSSTPEEADDLLAMLGLVREVTA